MSFELSNIITGLQKEGISVVHSGRTNAQRVTGALQQRFGEPPPVDFLALQLGLAELVETDLNRLLETDASHVRELVGNRLQIRERDAAFDETFEVLTGVRNAVEGVYGEPARVELFGDVSALPQDPLALHRLGVRIRDQLQGQELILPPVRLPGFPPVEREQLAAGLTQPLDRLGQVLSNLSLERKDADVSLLDKTQGIEGFRRTVRFAAGCLASLYGLAGLDELSRKIRPRRRARRRPNGSGPDSTDSGPDGSEPGAPEPDAPESAGPGAGSGDPDGAAVPAEEPASSTGETTGATRLGPTGIVN